MEAAARRHLREGRALGSTVPSRASGQDGFRDRRSRRSLSLRFRLMYRK